MVTALNQVSALFAGLVVYDHFFSWINQSFLFSQLDEHDGLVRELPYDIEEKRAWLKDHADLLRYTPTN
ncbi:hypothetical protein [Exiguobacterium sp. AT1b]|uniref:hypothetical protein n=2 Tax=unclassified Exiguobacterium TaxID=2644629 RepID=UPI00117BC3A4|nr:hypothetical protein [Exiguobacterium sp. AT1b]